MKYTFITNWLRDYSKEANDKTFVIGVSGGIDSAVTSTLCAETGALTYVVSLPIEQNKEELSRAESHIEWLCNKYENVIPLQFNLDEVFWAFKNVFEKEDKLALANSRSRLRMTTLYHAAAMVNGLVVGTGNKVEDFGIGFYTKYGDGGVDISPIADLMKSEVKEAACELGILLEIIDAAPTDGLWGDDRTDEDQIGCTYDELEWAMTFGGDKRKLTKRQKEVLKIFYSFQYRNNHKMVPIPICPNTKDA
jgi:NAD+ synthase